MFIIRKLRITGIAQQQLRLGAKRKSGQVCVMVSESKREISMGVLAMRLPRLADSPELVVPGSRRLVACDLLEF